MDAENWRSRSDESPLEHNDFSSEEKLPRQDPSTSGSTFPRRPVPLVSPPSMDDRSRFTGDGWQHSKRLEMLWTIDEELNVWIQIAGIGLKRIAPATVTGTLALAALAAHAHQTASPVDYREEADGLIHEMYVR
jgi:hypothetical protein